MKKISVVMIVKNEEALLARCLESVKDADEIIICDTGSKDRTMDIARQYTPFVFDDYEWNDNFAEARNHAKAKATGDWILSIDADEVCHDFEAVREAVEQGFMAIDVMMVSEGDYQRHMFPRLFRNLPSVHWVGAIHNHLSVLGESVGNVKISYGYSPAHELDPGRALRILEREARRPDGQRERYYLGREYFYYHRWDDCVKMLGRYVVESSSYSEKADAFMLMSRAYRYLGDWNSARDAGLQCILCNPHWKQAWYNMAFLAGEEAQDARLRGNAEVWRKAADAADNRNVLFLRDESIVESLAVSQ